MKYTITRACGHQETVELYGNGKEREWKLARMEDEDCADCRKSKKENEIKVRNESAEVVEMLYKDYKRSYSYCDTVPGTYDPETKSIKVYVPAPEKLEDRLVAKIIEMGRKYNYTETVARIAVASGAEYIEKEMLPALRAARDYKLLIGIAAMLRAANYLKYDGEKVEKLRSEAR